MVEYNKIFDESPPIVQASLATSDAPQASSTTTSTSEQNEKLSDNPSTAVMVRSGTTGAVVGLFLGGPIMSALLGFTAAYASQKQDVVGDAARSLGDAGAKGWEAFVKFVNDRRLLQRGVEGAGVGYEFVAERVSGTSNDGQGGGKGGRQ